MLNRIRGPFNLSERAAGRRRGGGARPRPRRALRAENARLRDWLAEALAEVGVPSDTSCANFVLARFADADEAQACDDTCAPSGIIVRRVAGYGLPHCLRITIGDEASCRRVAHAIGQFKAAWPAMAGEPARDRELYRRVALIGLGLIAVVDGACDAAERAGGRDRRQRAIGRNARDGARDRAVRPGRGDSAAEAVKGADLVVLAVPVGAMGEVAAEIAPAPGARARP